MGNMWQAKKCLIFDVRNRDKFKYKAEIDLIEVLKAKFFNDLYGMYRPRDKGSGAFWKT